MRILLRDLSPGTKYHVQVRSTSGHSVSEWSRQFEINTMVDDVAPDQPEGLTITMSGAEANMSWSPVVTNEDGTPITDLSGYVVTVKSPGSPFSYQKNVGLSTNMEFSLDTNRETFGSPRGSLFFEVYAEDSVGNTSAVATSSTVSTPPPANVTGFQATADQGAINLKWALLSDPNITGYRVYMGVSPLFTLDSPVAEVSANICTIPTTAYGTDLYFKIVAVDVFGVTSVTPTTAGPVSPLSPFVLDTDAPGVPSGLSATISDSIMTVSWNAVSDTDMKYYIVSYRKVGSSEWTTSNVPYDQTATAIPVETEVNYDVRIRSSDMLSNMSNWSSVFTTDTAEVNTAPSPPTGVTMTLGRDNLQISWNENPEDDMKNNAGTYDVLIAKNPSFSLGLLQYRTGATSLSVNGLDTNTQYWARVRATDRGGLSSGYASIVTGVTGTFPETSLSDGNAPASSPTPSVSGGFGYIHASWTPIANNDMVTYEVHLGTAAGFTLSASTKVGEISGSTIIIERTGTGTDLAYGTNYYVRTRAKDVDGMAPASTSSSAVQIMKIGSGDTTITPGDIGAATPSDVETAKQEAIGAAELDATAKATEAMNKAMAALSAAQSAQATADNAIRTYYDSTPPWPNGSSQPDDVLGDMWYDDNTGQAYRWNGTDWIVIVDQTIGEALSAAQNAQSTADGKITAFYQTSAPIEAEPGDLWFDTDDNSKVYYRTTSDTWAVASDPKTLADQAEANATAVANTKNRTFTGASEPTAPTGGFVVGDMWIDNNGKVYRWNGSWIVATDPQAYADEAESNAIAAASTDATNKANAAKDAAEAAANNYADLVASNAAQDAIDAAAIDAANKANAAEQAAYDAAVAEAQVKANAAKQEAINAAAQDASDKDELVEGRAQSRGTDLVTNGTGYLRNNYNFSTLTYDGTDAPTGITGSFSGPVGAYTSPRTDEFMPVDPSKTYQISCFARQKGPAGTGRLYMLYEAADSSGQVILSAHFRFIAGTTTTLAAPLNPGDTVVQLTDATGWHNGSSQHFRRFIFWDYTDPQGKLWEPETYSRNVTAHNTWAEGGISGNTITLNSPYNGSAKPAGTAVSCNNGSSSYMYIAWMNDIVSTEWTQKFDFITGTTDPAKGNQVPDSDGYHFPPGTAAVRLGWLLNYSPTGPSNIAVAGVSLSDTSAASYAANHITETQIMDDAITTPKIKTGAVVADSISAGAVGAIAIDAEVITSNHIAAHSVDADRFRTSTMESTVITLGAGGIIKTNTGGVQITDSGIIIPQGHLDANILKANSAFVTTLNIGAGGAIQSTGYTTGGSSGFRLSNTGLVIKGSGNTVDASVIKGGTITGTTVNVGAGGTLNIDSTAQVKSNNYAAGSTGYRLSSTGFEINDGTVDAKTLKANSSIVNELIIGAASSGPGAIKSFDYAANTAGFRLSTSGLEINKGSISAEALRLQLGRNLMHPAYADFEYEPTYYNGNVGEFFATTSTSTTQFRFGTRSLMIVWGGNSGSSVTFAPTDTSYNVRVDPSKKHIISAYVYGVNTYNLQIRIRADRTSGGPATNVSGALPAGAGWQRIQFEWTPPANATGDITVGLETIGSSNGATTYVDGVQVEELTGASGTPASTYFPPSTTTIDGGAVRTGSIRSSALNSRGEPFWSINMSGNAVFNRALVQEELIVGDPSDVNKFASIQSVNYITDTSGWRIGSDGKLEANEGEFKGAIKGGTIEASVSVSTGGALISGNPSGARVEQSDDGVRVWKIGPNGLPHTATVLSTDETSIGVFGPDGGVIGGISSLGAVKGTVGTFSQAVQVAGTSLLGQIGTSDSSAPVGWLDLLSRGILKSGATSTQTTNKPTGTEYKYVSVKVPLKKGRLYRVKGILHAVPNATNGVIRMNIRYATGSSVPTTSSPAVYSSTTSGMVYNAGVQMDTTLEGFHTVEADTDTTFVMTYTGLNGATPSARRGRLYVEDIGPRVGTEIEVGEDETPKVTYTAVWKATASRGYNKTGAAISGSDGNINLWYWHGDPSEFNSTAWVYGGTSIAPTDAVELGKTMVQALSGATIISAQVYLRNKIWYNEGDSGHILLGSLNHASVTMPSTKVIDGTVAGPDMIEGEGLWIDVPEEWFANGSNIGVTLGDKDGTSAIGSLGALDSGEFHGIDDDDPPLLRIVYSK